MNIPKGYMLVPIVPTPKMLENADFITPRGLHWGREEKDGNVANGAELIWAAMLLTVREEGVP